jgi:hypothetical protein
MRNSWKNATTPVNRQHSSAGLMGMPTIVSEQWTLVVLNSYSKPELKLVDRKQLLQDKKTMESFGR